MEKISVFKKVTGFRFLIVLMIFSGCQSIEKRILKDNSKLVEEKFLLLEKETEGFLNQPEQSNFLGGLENYISNYKGYDFYDGREDPSILKLVLLNEDKDKCMAFILTRTLDNADKRVEYVKFISGKYENDKWSFKLKKGWTFSSRYFNEDIEALTDKRISEDVVRRFMLEGYLRSDIIFDERLLESGYYVW